MKDAVIVSAVRTPVGKAPNGSLKYTRPDEMAATAIAEAVIRTFACLMTTPRSFLVRLVESMRCF